MSSARSLVVASAPMTPRAPRAASKAACCRIGGIMALRELRDIVAPDVLERPVASKRPLLASTWPGRCPRSALAASLAAR